MLFIMLQALLLALQLWPALPPSALTDIKLLPAGATPPPKNFFTGPDVPQEAAAGAAAAFFTVSHLQKLLPVLRASSSSHPRLHSVWPTLLALLLPGFTALRVSSPHPQVKDHCQNTHYV